MVKKNELLLTEIDRQHVELQQQSIGVAHRASLLIAGAAVGVVLLAPELGSKPSVVEVLTAVALGLAITAGIVAVSPALAVGPDSSSLTTWKAQVPDEAVPLIYAAKISVLTANRRRMWWMVGALWTQGFLLFIAVVLAFIAAVGR